jgi:FMN phosphatase YigB (HAD superfamily)
MPRAIFIDVDDTLVRSFGGKRIPITPIIELVKNLALSGAELYCWSSGGSEYAAEVARELAIADCFRAFLPKPNVLIDDSPIASWKMLRLHPNECLARSAAEIVNEE